MPIQQITNFEALRKSQFKDYFQLTQLSNTLGKRFESSL